MCSFFFWYITTKIVSRLWLFSRRTKALGVDKFIEDLACDPWNTMDTMDDKYHFWKTLFDTIVEKQIAHLNNEIDIWLEKCN